MKRANESTAAVLEQIAAGLDALVDVNVAHLSVRPGVPALYDSKVRYIEEPDEVRQDVPTVLQHGRGDAEDLVAWRIAELRVRGVEARVLIRQVRSSSGLAFYHPLVQLPDGTVEDPARILVERYLNEGGE